MMNTFDGIASSLKRIEELLEVQTISNKEFYCFREACQYLSVSPSMLYKMTSGAKIPFSRPNGKLMYFRKEDLDAWIMIGREEVC